MAKYKVPDGGLKAALDRWPCTGDERHRTLDRLEAFIRWQSENPVVPTEKQALDMYTDFPIGSGIKCAVSGAVEWQRWMYLVPEPEVPETLKDCLIEDDRPISRECHNARIIEAYRRGRESTK